MAGNIVRRQGKLKLVLTPAGADLLAVKGDHTALKVLEQALFDSECVTYSQLIHKFFTDERWPMTELRDIMSAVSKHLPMVHQADKIDPAAIVEVFSSVSVPLPFGYNLKNERRVMMTADYVCGAAVYLNGLYRTGRLGGRDVWNEVQKHSPSQAVAEALMLVVHPSMRDPGRSRDILTESLQRICQTYGLTLTGNCAVKLYDLLADELATLRKAEQVMALPKLKTSARLEVVELVVTEESVSASEVVSEVMLDEVMSVVPEPAAESPIDTVRQSPVVIRTSQVKAGIYSVAKAALAQLEVTGWPVGMLNMKLLTRVVVLVQPTCPQPAVTVAEMNGVFWDRVSTGVYQMRDVSVTVFTGAPRAVAEQVTPAQIQELVQSLLTDTGVFGAGEVEQVKVKCPAKPKVEVGPESAEETFRRLLPGRILEREQDLQKRRAEQEKREKGLVSVQEAIDAALARKATLETELAAWRAENEPLMAEAEKKLGHLKALLE
ncbi:TPA: hypothetical protein DEP96_00625 [Candidatus Uhrbacteria bacterium]|nr:hypothetical protein [Candidatus Uhrbacteria bacterium]